MIILRRNETWTSTLSVPNLVIDGVETTLRAANPHQRVFEAFNVSGAHHASSSNSNIHLDKATTMSALKNAALKKISHAAMVVGIVV